MRLENPEQMQHPIKFCVTNPETDGINQPVSVSSSTGPVSRLTGKHIRTEACLNFSDL